MQSSDPAELEGLVAALSRPLPELPSKYFYNDRGSELFEQITQQPEYYPTRTETALLEAHADDIVALVQPNELAEIGSGVGEKIRLLLDSMQRAGLLQRAAMLEINELFLQASVDQLRELYPGLDVRGLRGDFGHDLHRFGPGGARLMLFLAGTIGNLHPDSVPGFLRDVAAQMEPGDGFLVGLDLVKNTDRLEAAYNDQEGVTADFNLNILDSVNTRFGTRFDRDAFEHVAFFDRTNSWIEMRLRALRDSTVDVPGTELSLSFSAGDEIRTELSCKYTRESLSERAAAAGLVVDRWYTDEEGLFALALLRRG